MSPHPSSRNGGFTIAELIIGVSLSLMVMTAVLSSYVFIARSYARTIGFGDAGRATLESQGRRTLATFAQDAGMALAVLPSTLPDSPDFQIAFTLPNATGGTKTVTYCYNSANADAPAEIPLTAYTIPKKTLVRIDGGTATMLSLHSSLKTCTLLCYDISGNPYTSFDNYLLGIKQVALSLSAQGGVAEHGTLTSVYQVASPRLLLRNKALPLDAPGSKGSVVLVALSCVTVLGIAMASFLAVSNQAMKLSNRTYAQAVSKQLAQMGLERALRSFDDNTFAAASPENWTLSGVTATKTLSIASSRYGNSGITASVKIRVDHYLASKKATPWSMLLNYVKDDFVWYQGVWYVCTTPPPAKEAPDNANYWKSAPQPWTANANYKVGNIALVAGISYRCIKAHNNFTPPNTTYWTALSIGAGTAVPVWNASPSYAVDNVVYFESIPYRCLAANSNRTPTNTAYWLSGPVIYAEGIAVLPDSSSTTLKTQLRATLGPAALFPNAIAAASYANLSAGGTVDSYNQALGFHNQDTPPFDSGSPNISSSAVIAGGRTSSSAVNIRGMRVNGYVAVPSSSTTPYNPQWSYNTSNGILTAERAATVPSPVPKIDLKRVSRSPYIPQFDIQSIASLVPAVTINYLANPSGTVTLPRGSDNPNTADGKYYYYTNGDLNIGAGDTLKIVGPVVIDVRPSNSADFYVIDNGSIQIVHTPSSTPPVTTSSLEVHFGGQLQIGNDDGEGGIDNVTRDPARCVILGTSSVDYSSHHFLRSAVNFIGVIYMPDAYLYVKRAVTIYGAVSASNIRFETNPTHLHYDVGLRNAVISGVDTPYEIAEWRELTDPTERVTLP